MSEIPKTPELADDVKQLEALLADAEELMDGIDDEGFRWRSEPGRWSISECLEHLSITLNEYAPGIEECIREGRRQGKTGLSDPKRGWIMGWLIRSMEPPPAPRFKAPSSFKPDRPKPKDEVYPRFLRLHQDLGAAMADADGLDLRKNRLVSPITSLLRMGLGEAFALMLSHGRRHVWQARQVRESPGFPGT